MIEMDLQIGDAECDWAKGGHGLDSLSKVIAVMMW
jgi:hypothetical protein